MLYCADHSEAVIGIATSISELASQPINVTLLCSSIAHVTLNVDTVLAFNLKSERLDLLKCSYFTMTVLCAQLRWTDMKTAQKFGFHFVFLVCARGLSGVWVG